MKNTWKKMREQSIDKFKVQMLENGLFIVITTWGEPDALGPFEDYSLAKLCCDIKNEDYRKYGKIESEIYNS